MTVLVAYDQTDTQGVADSVVKYLRREQGYDVLVVGPGHARRFEDLDASELRGARFFLELDAVSGVPHHTEGLARLACPKLAWFVDSHKKPLLQQRIAEEFDVVFFTMWAWGGLFGSRGRWLPVHYDAEWIGPRPGTTPTFDVGFVGSRPQERTRALQDVGRRHGLSLLLETTTGPREKELTADLYARCRVVFNQHVANDLNFRVVEAQGCRKLLLTDAQRNGQYELFRDREHVVYYKDDGDLETLLLHYLGHADERERIAAAGHALVSREHTTSARARQLAAVAEELLRARGDASVYNIGHEAAAPAPPRALLLARRIDAQDPGGIRAAGVARALVAAGVPLDVVTLAPGADGLGARVHVATGPAPPKLPDAAVASALLAGVPLLDAAAGVLAESPVDVVVVAAWEEATAARELGRPYVLVVPPVAAGSAAEGEVWAAQGAALVLVGDEARRGDLLERAPSLAGKVHVVDVAGGAPADAARLVALLRGAVDGGTRYDREYMVRYGYCTRSPDEVRLKRVQAQVIARVLRPRRALVAGCAAGELLIPLQALGVDAWGFDAAEGLASFVYPEVRAQVLPFDVAELARFPFERAGGAFDTFVAVDLFEHVAEDRVDAMLDGLAAFERLALVISSSPAFEGHVCVQPFPWWSARLEARGFELLPEPSALSPEEAATYGVRRFEGVREDMSEQLVFFRRGARAAATAATAGAPASVPDVSIGVVCCDRPDVLEVTLESTRAALVTSALDVEWLAFDNGSDGAVRRVLEDGAFDGVLRSARNQGLAPALDALYRASRGRHVLVLEDDWECLASTPEWLELAVAVLDTQPDVGVVRLRRRDDGQCGHWKRHRPEVALRHHPWSVEPLPDVVETRTVRGQPVYVAAAEWVNWTHNPTLCRREVRDWLGPLAGYLPDPRDHRPRADHPGLEGAIDLRWRAGPWKAAKLLDGPFTHVGDRPARVGAGA